MTDEVRAAVGHTVTYHAPEPLGRASIRHFALAIGADPDRWVDEAPPTLICETCQLTGRRTPDDSGYLGHTWDLPFPVPCALIRGGNDYVFHRPVGPDDVITTRWELTEMTERYDRVGRPLVVATAVASYFDAAGGPVATNTETLLFRPLVIGDAPAATDRAKAPTPSPDIATTAVADAAGRPSSDPAPPGALRVGDRLADLARQLDLTDLVAYGAATWDWHRLHYDTAFARRAGMPGPVVDGQLFGALLAEQALRATGPESRVTRLRFRNRAPVVAGSMVRCQAVVAEVDGNGFTVDATVGVGDEMAVAPAAVTVTRR
jgi:acyl dehydratase